MKKLYVLVDTGGDGFCNEFILLVAETKEQAEELIGKDRINTIYDNSHFMSNPIVREFNPNDFAPGILYDMNEDED